MIKDKSKINRPIVWLILIDVLVFIGLVAMAFLAYSKVNHRFGDTGGNSMEALGEDLQEIKKIVSIQKNSQALIGSSLVDGASAVQLIQAIVSCIFFRCGPFDMCN